MRGVVSAGMVAALEYLGLLPAFDVIYGTSAGAINGAYFVAGQAAYGASIYFENINNPQFVSPLRLVCGDRLVSLEFLFEHVMIREKPLDWQGVLDSHIELVPVATSIQRAAAVLLRGARSRYDLYSRLKASARIPFVAGPPVPVDGEDCVDGGLYASIPFRQALDEGCTHVLALLTRPAGATLKRSSSLCRYMVSRKLARYNPLLRNAFFDRVGQYARELDWLNAQTYAPTCRSPYVCAVSPPHSTPLVSRFEKRWECLVSGARSGVGAIMDAFRQPNTSSLQVLFPSRPSGYRSVSLRREEDAEIGTSALLKPATGLLDTRCVGPASGGVGFQQQSFLGGGASNA